MPSPPMGVQDTRINIPSLAQTPLGSKGAQYTALDSCKMKPSFGTPPALKPKQFMKASPQSTSPKENARFLSKPAMPVKPEDKEQKLALANNRCKILAFFVVGILLIVLAITLAVVLAKDDNDGESAGPEGFRDSHRCGVNEVYQTCATPYMCEHYCGRDIATSMCITVCVEKCVCKTGFVRRGESDQVCIEAALCPTQAPPSPTTQAPQKPGTPSPTTHAPSGDSDGDGGDGNDGDGSTSTPINGNSSTASPIRDCHSGSSGHIWCTPLQACVPSWESHNCSCTMQVPACGYKPGASNQTNQASQPPVTAQPSST